jgi:hypothetical protein
LLLNPHKHIDIEEKKLFGQKGKSSGKMKGRTAKCQQKAENH